ncbi:MAG: DUF2188 domain-containing protein [Solirubrobacterales bacterium]|jgi:hypothetical protein
MIGNRYVQPSKKDGGWEILKEGHRRATGHAPTQAQAVEQARRLARSEGGGEVRVKDRTGKIADVRVVRSATRRRSSR